MDRNSHTWGNGGGEFAHVEKNVGVGAFLISHIPRFADMVCKYLMCVIFWSHRCFFSVDVLGMGDEQHQITILCVQYEFIAFFRRWTVLQNRICLYDRSNIFIYKVCWLHNSLPIIFYQNISNKNFIQSSISEIFTAYFILLDLKIYLVMTPDSL